MDHSKIGNLIYRLRKENNMTQLQFAEKLHISDKAVSKWERGLGCPDVSLLSDLSQVFDVDLEKLLSGQLDPQRHGKRKYEEHALLCMPNMRKFHYFHDRCRHLLLWEKTESDAATESCRKRKSLRGSH